MRRYLFLFSHSYLIESDRRALLTVRQQGGIGKAGPLRDVLGELLNGRVTAVLILCAQDAR